MKKFVRAVGYLRRSTKDQEGSLEDQRAAITEYAKQNGYHIIEWYEDDGISGDDTANRLDFLRMLENAATGEFEVILCWDQDRFGRFDSLDAGYYIKPIRDAGVQLVTINEGPIDWNDFTARLMYSIKQEAKHQFLRDLSRNVLRGQSEAAKAGSWIGSAPYGYTLTGPKKNKQLEVDEPRMAIVRKMFTEYVEDGRSLSDIARRLTAEGHPTPRGRVEWRGDAIRFILMNPVYIGTFRYNTHGSSKYHSYRGGAIARGGHNGRKPPEDWLIIEDHHPAEIDKALYERAQAMLVSNRNGQTNYPDGDNPYIFSRVLRCGRCDHVMVGDAGDRYRCGNRTPGKRCVGTVVQEQALLEHLTNSLTDYLIDGDPAMHAAEQAANVGKLRPEDLPKSFARLRRIITGKTSGSGGDSKRLRERIASIDAKLAKLRQNIGYVDDPATIDVIASEIKKHDEQRDSLQRQLVARPTDIDINDAVLDLIADLMYMSSGNVAAIRRVLRDVDQITVSTSLNGRKGNGRRHSLKSLEVTWLGVGAAPGKANPRLAV